jgi:hypothetical protein
LTLFACFPRAVRVLFGSLLIVLFLRAAPAAFLMFRLAAAFCRLVVAMAQAASEPLVPVASGAA